jgi:hypothetical protein
MRRSEIAWCACALVVAAGACVVPLDSDHATDAAADAGVASGCPVLATATGATALAGDARSIVLADGGALWVVDQARGSDGGIVLPAAFVAASGEGCTAAAAFAGGAMAPSPLEADGLIVPLDLVATSTGVALYYVLFASDPSAPFGIRDVGVGLAPRDDARGLFVPTRELLWSADRPAYGGSALRVGETVYVWGCKGADAFTSDCYVARAAASALASSAAYTYWNGAGWSPRPDDATPITQGGGVVSVRPDPGGARRLVMTYVPPLGGTVLARSAPAPEGPWSAAATLFACALDGAGLGAFCGGGEQHPESANGDLAITYAARSFDAGAADAAAFVPRLVRVGVPRALP